MKKAAAAYGAEIVSDTNYPPNTTNFSPFIQTTMAAKPDAIYLGGVTQEVLPRRHRDGGETAALVESPALADAYLGGTIHR